MVWWVTECCFLVAQKKWQPIERLSNGGQKFIPFPCPAELFCVVRMCYFKEAGVRHYIISLHFRSCETFGNFNTILYSLLTLKQLCVCVLFYLKQQKWINRLCILEQNNDWFLLWQVTSNLHQINTHLMFSVLR